MLDTIILQIPFSEGKVNNPHRFFPVAQNLLAVKAPFYKWKSNHTKEEKEKKIYRPRLTIIKRGYQLFLKIEFSAPKLLLGNNLDEVEQEDFEQIVRLLRDGIKEMGATIWTHELENAQVLSFHPSKNIVLNNGYTSDFVIKELYKANVSKTFDLNKADFRNNGQSLQVYTNSHSFVVYDKINDLAKPEKRAIDKEQTKQQRSLFELIRKEHKRLEVIRFEVRLSSKRKMAYVLRDIGYTDKSPIFKEIFYKDICKALVQKYWNDYFGKNLFIFSVENNPQNILRSVLMANPKLKIAKAVQEVGLRILCKDDEGIRGFRAITEGLRGKDSWSYINRQIKALGAPKQAELHGFVRQIEQGLRDFKALKLNLKIK